MWLLQLPSSNLSTPFLTNGTFLNRFSKPISSFTLSQSHSLPLPSIKAMKTMEGKVVCAVNDKTVAVEVTRLAPHPKYKKRIRKKKKYQAHDPENEFKIGDIVQLRKTKPISKNKTFLAVPAPARNLKNNNINNSSGELGIPLQSEEEEEQSQA